MSQYIKGLSSKMPNGGVDTYEGSRVALCPTAQMQASMVFNDMPSGDPSGKTIVKEYDYAGLQNMSVGFKYSSTDLAESIGITRCETTQNTTLMHTL